MKRILLWTLLLPAVAIATSNNISQLPSMDWQKQALEDRTKQKIDDVLKSVLKPSQYNVDIKIETRGVVEPEFDKPLSEKNKEDDSKLDVGEYDSETGEESSDSAQAAAADDKRESTADVKFVDTYPEESPEDYIIFNKFGLEAPLVDDFNDFQPDGKIVLSMTGGGGQSNQDKAQINAMKAREKQYIEQIRDLKNEKRSAENKVSPIEQLWMYNNAVDIFKNLKSVDILVRVSNEVTEETKQAVERYVKAINFNLGKVKPNIKIEYGLLGALAAETPTDQLFKILDYLTKFSTFLGIVFGVILFGLIGRSLIQKYFDLNSAQSQSGQFKMDGGEGVAGEDGDGTDHEETSGTREWGSSVVPVNGIERFETFFEKDPQNAMLLIKKWISEDDDRASKSLRSLVQQFENAQLAEVFKHLSEEERASWKKLLDRPLTREELDIANAYIGNQIVQSIIVEKYVDDPETFDLLLRLTPKQVAMIVEREASISGALLNSLSANFVSQVLGLCSEQVQSQMVRDAVALTPDQIRSKQDEIKEVLKQYDERVTNRPFVEKILSLLPMAMPSTENNLFQALYDNGDQDLLKKTARKYFPADYIPKLPTDFLKELLMAYPMNKKVEMLYPLEETIKEQLIDIFAPEGSKAYDLLELEFENIETNDVRQTQLLNNGDKNWKEFVNYVRDKIEKDTNYQAEITDLLDQWVLDKMGGQTMPDLKVVA